MALPSFLGFLGFGLYDTAVGVVNIVRKIAVVDAFDTSPLIGSNNQPKLSCSESVEKKAAFFLARSFALLLIGFFVPSR